MNNHANTSCQENGGFPEEAIEFDTYSGVELRVSKLEGEVEPHLFAEKLKSSLEEWIKEGKRGIWIFIPTHMAHLVPSCVENGFDFHFAKKGNLVLTRWLPESPSRLPLGPTHQVGVGCFVVHPTDDKSMLVVKEKTGPAANYGLWKMPTGLLDPNEDIAEAATRELKEETGLDGKLVSIMTFRQAHNPLADKGSDLFFVCKMELMSDISQLQIQEEEIAAIQWMPIEDYASQTVWQGSPLYKKMNQVMTVSPESGFSEAKLEVGYRPGSQTLYIPKNDV